MLILYILFYWGGFEVQILNYWIMQRINLILWPLEKGNLLSNHRVFFFRFSNWCLRLTIWLFQPIRLREYQFDNTFWKILSPFPNIPQMQRELIRYKLYGRCKISILEIDSKVADIWIGLFRCKTNCKWIPTSKYYYCH